MVSFQRPRIIFGWSSSILILACMSAVALWKRLLDVLILETCLIPFAADVCRCNIYIYILYIYISIISQFFMPPLCFNDLQWSLMCFSSAHSTHSTLGNPCSHVPEFNRNWRQSKLPRHRIWLTRAILQPTWCYWWWLGADTIWHNDGMWRKIKRKIKGIVSIVIIVMTTHLAPSSHQELVICMRN